MINKEEIETPALILDEKKLNKNIDRMMKVSEHGVTIRPHFKTHKSVWIAKRQIEKGASGITVATASEAELLFENGLTDILLAFPLADPVRLKKLLKWSKRARLILTVDSEEQVKIIEAIAKELIVTPEVWIKVNSGLNRCGVEPGVEAFNLAECINNTETLDLTGMYTHAGHSYAAKCEEEVNRIAKQEAESILRSVELCEKNGIIIPNRSIGSTPTFERGAKYAGITEVRPGNAVFFDNIQVALGIASEEEVALTVLASIASVKNERIIIDAGSKALTTEKGAHGNEGVIGFGRVITNEKIFVSRVSEEHGIIDNMQNPIFHKLNEKVHIVPNHACPVVNLFNFYYVIKENGDYEKVCVDGRGMSQ
ncbi:alanine racemase [Evansella cellulosilytica]|uniref:Alanine racemase domain protein n=1 Tax=Evansella cellulosilytica (strain ATCC 21833 / DSM 2522 / FERM P-1141 / JCM 9156 / N-4) TaxID=649639 RepID=E6U058_EVAC2|nr:alanine racemase [Evansella cellulosilytica]ADU29062.1 alanine racemase domain protein [Evansella cellulosilytica DSM 2522]